MCADIQELKYLLSLCRDTSEETCDEILQHVDEYEYCKGVNGHAKLSEAAFTTVKKVARVNATLVFQLIRALTRAQYIVLDDHKDVIKHIIEDEIVRQLNGLNDGSGVRRQAVYNIFTLASELFQLLEHLNDDDVQSIHSKLSKLKDYGYEKELRLCLLCSERIKSVDIEEAKACRNSKWPLDPDDMLCLCYGSRKHWLLLTLDHLNRLLESSDPLPLNSDNVSVKLWQLTFVGLMNDVNDIDPTAMIKKINKLSDVTKYHRDNESFNTYYNEIVRETNLISFCLNNSKKKKFFLWYDMCCNHSALSVISQICDINKLDWFKVRQALVLNNEYLYKDNSQRRSSTQWDIMTYNAYCLVTLVIDYVSNSSETPDDGRSNADEIKSMISNLNPLSYRLEILNVIFSCLFIRQEDFSETEPTADSVHTSHSDGSYFMLKTSNRSKRKNNTGFVCNYSSLRNVLYILKECMAEMSDEFLSKSADSDESETKISNQWKALKNFISVAVWKCEFVNNMDFLKSDVLNSVPVIREDLFASSLKRRRKTKKTRSKSYNENICSTSLINNLNDRKIIKEPDFISLMLSSPSCLLTLCLDFNDFNKAHKIIQMYDLMDSDSYLEVSFAENFSKFVDKIKNSAFYSKELNPKEIDSSSSSSLLSTAVVGSVETFLSTHKVPHNYCLLDLAQTFPQLQIYDDCNSTFFILIDILVSTGVEQSISYGILNVIEKRMSNFTVGTEAGTKQMNFFTFIKNQLDIFYKTHEKEFSSSKRGVCAFINSDRVPITYKKYLQLENNINELSGLHKNYSNWKNLSSPESFDRSSVLLKQRKLYMSSVMSCDNDECSYFQQFICYIKNMSKLSGLNDTSGDETKIDSEIFSTPLHVTIGTLINERGVPLTKIEEICKSFKTDLIHKLVLNHCPRVKCSTDSDVVFDEDDSDVSDGVSKSDETQPGEAFKKPTQEIITYILSHNWVIANLLKKIHRDNSEHVLEHSIDTRTRYMDNFLKLKKFGALKCFFHDNVPLTALQGDFDWKRVSERLRFYYHNERYSEGLALVNALPEYALKKKGVDDFRNKFLLKLCLDQDVEDTHVYFLSLTDTALLESSVLDNLKNWDYNSALEILMFFAHRSGSENEFLKNESILWLERISLYQEISKLTDEHKWSDIHTISYEDPEKILQLFDEKQFQLCLEWCELHAVSNNVKKLILYNLLKQYIQSPSDVDPSYIQNHICNLPAHEAISLCKEMIVKLRDIEVLKIVHSFLQQNSYNSQQYDNLKIGIEFIAEIDPNERVLFWDLIEKPLLIVEQYLMNAKLDSLERLLKKIRPMLDQDPLGDNLFYNISLINKVSISLNAVDSLLRIYAGKALDFKLKSNKRQKFPSAAIQNPATLDSTDSINLVGNPGFTMPDNVPNKEEWVQNNMSDNCMVCKTTCFSILIRKHHCRRCGRLVCYSCSRHRMQLPGYYSDIKVRICDDCYAQSMEKIYAVSRKTNALTYPISTSAQSDSPSMMWCLTSDQKHNDELRKEFVYEFSPDVHLCLSIMRLHSTNLTYPRFLLDRSSELSRTVGKADEGVLELLRMQKALLVSCVVLYTQPIPSTSTTTVDMALEHTQYLLSVTDALARLATHGCHSLMPEVGSIDTHYIRQLLKVEKWELALEICTKFGLSKIGVLATWGKACLKSGCFGLARQKFSLCFKGNKNLKQKSQNEGVPLPAVEKLRKTDSYQSDLNKNNSALLDEIVSLLELNCYCTNVKFPKKVENSKPPHENFHETGIKTQTLNTSALKMTLSEEPLNINHALAGLNRIKEGDFSDFSTLSHYAKKSKQIGLLKKHSGHNEKFEYRRKIEPFYYNECIYYLTTYGSHSKLINFYLKYDNLIKALQHCHVESVDKETFVEHIFMKYLNGNKINELLKVMNGMDSSWKIWTEYLMYACRLLQHKGWLEALLTVQSGIGDHIRAAITCVSLYSRPTKPPHIADLHTRTHYLAQARGHLQHVPRKSKQNETEESSKSLILMMDSATIDRHINTICKQMDIIMALYVCEMSGRLTDDLIKEILTLPKPKRLSSLKKDTQYCLPTLFGNYEEKVKICILIMASGSSIKESLGMVIRLIKDYNLDPSKVFNLAAIYFINNDNYDTILTLCDLIREFYDKEPRTLIDNIIETSIAAVVRKCDASGQLFDELAEMFISKTESISLKISCYIECRLLKTAYHLAVQNNRFSDLRRIMNEAERLGQSNVKNACIKKMNLVNQT